MAVEANNDDERPWKEDDEDYRYDDFSSHEYYWPPCHDLHQAAQGDGEKQDEKFIIYLSTIVQGVLVISALMLLFYSSRQLFYYYRMRRMKEENEENIGAEEEGIELLTASK